MWLPGVRRLCWRLRRCKADWSCPEGRGIDRAWGLDESGWVVQWDGLYIGMGLMGAVPAWRRLSSRWGDAVHSLVLLPH